MSVHDDEVERLLESYRGRIGAEVGELATPALLLDLAAAERNIAAMQERMRGGAALRPHAKTHKSPELAARQIRAGAIGIMTATVWEAVALARAGVSDVMVANVVRGAEKCAAVAEVAGLTRTTVVIDDAGNADELDAAAGRAGVALDVLVELDVGQHRTGVRSPDEALSVARHVAGKPRLRLRGVHGYEGNVSLVQDGEERRRGAAEAADIRAACAEAIRGDGLTVDVVSGGGTGMWDSTGLDPRVTEIHPGSYVFMDTSHWCQVPDPEPALFVLATVLSRKGSTVVLDSGRKSLGTVDPVPPVVRDVPGPVTIFHEEHLAVECDAGPLPGSTVTIIPSYAPAAVTLHEVYHVIADGRVADIWPVLARGGGREGARPRE